MDQLMRTRTLALEDYWTTLARVLPEFSPEQQHTAVTLYRELAKGRPLTTERVASVLGVPSEKAAEELARDPLRAFVYAHKGQIVGVGGLAAAPMHHEFRVKGQTLWTWCAWDSLFIPTVLGDTADVSSPDPETCELVRLTVSPIGIERVEPKDAVVSFPVPGEGDFAQSAENVMGTFCHSVFFFTSRESGERWRSTHEGMFLYSLDDAFELGLRLVKKQFGHELERLSAGRGDVARSIA
jgi:alkylmercury lyase